MSSSAGCLMPPGSNKSRFEGQVSASAPFLSTSSECQHMFSVPARCKQLVVRRKDTDNLEQCLRIT